MDCQSILCKRVTFLLVLDRVVLMATFKFKHGSINRIAAQVLTLYQAALRKRVEMVKYSP